MLYNTLIIKQKVYLKYKFNILYFNNTNNNLTNILLLLENLHIYL